MTHVRKMLPLLATLLSPGLCPGGARFPFHVSYGGASNATSVAHMLDAPAGKHGFVRVEGGEFATDAGPIRFNGTNLTGPANFPSRADADRLAARLSRLGINCVRLHYMDVWYSNFMRGGERGQGILDDDATTQRKLSSAQLDRLDYLVAALKKSGVYVNMNLHVARTLDERDGCPPGSPWANKTVGQFMPRMIELQKEYARDLLTHVNPYTGRAYREEPSVAMIEISNEDPGVVQFDRGGKLAKLRKPFKDELRRQWNAYLRKTHPGDAAFLEEKPLFCDDREGLSPLKHDWARFLWRTEETYWNGMKDYIHNELKAPQPVSGTQVGYSPLTIQKKLDYVDAHSYFHHPGGVGGGWKTPGVTNEWTVGGESMVHALGLLKTTEARKRAQGRPFTLSEYSNPYPSPFIAECQPVGCAFGRTMGWNGVFQYSYNHYPEDFEPKSMPWCIFDGIANPAILVHFPAAAAIIVRGDLPEDAEGRLGAFEWNRDRKGREYVAAKASNAKLFAGYADGRTVPLGDGVELSVGATETGWAVVSLVSLHATGFGSGGAASVLVAASGRADNDGTRIVRKSARRVSFAERGTGPVLAEGIPLRFSLPAEPGRVKCWALGPDGARGAAVNPDSADDGAGSELSLSPEFRTLWYEVEVAGFLK